jgi:MFS transporter, DHA2 family, multidrug resistance protein
MAHAVVSRTPANKWVIASTVVLASFVVVMDVSIVNVAMPQMLGEFGVPLDTITWVAVAYSIAEIIMVTLAAWCSVFLGRKRFYLLSFSIFTAASMLCGMARSLEMIIFARLLQGFGGGGLIPVAQAIVLETFPEEERGMAMAIYSMGVVVAPTVGPVLGGWLTDTYGWPWIFYVNVPVGLLGIFLAATVLHDPPYMQRRLARIDVVGIILLAIGLTALQISLARGERENWFDSSFIVTTSLIALVALLLLVSCELWVEDPIINLRLLKNLRFTAGTCLGFVFGITLFGSLFLLPLSLQRLRGYSVLDSGLMQMPQMLIMFAITPIAGRLYNYVDGRLLIGAGVAMMMLGYFDLAHLTLEVGPAQLLPGLLLTGAGMSCMFGTMSANVMRTVPNPMLTAASGLYTLFRRIGGNLGYAMVASQIAHRTAFHRVRLLDHLTPYDPGPTLALDNLTARLAGSGLPPGVAADNALQILSGTVNRHATMMAYNDVFWMMGMLFAVGLPFLMMLGGRTPHPTPAPVSRQPAPQVPVGSNRA